MAGIENEERVLGAAAVAANSDDDDQERDNEKVIRGFEPSEGFKNILRNGSLWKVGVINEGEGEFGVEPGMWVTINYKGWIIRHRKNQFGVESVETRLVEDTSGLGGPLKFKLGVNDARIFVLPAITWAVWDMKKGEKSVFIAHHLLGYRSSPEIPFRSDLKLEIEVVDFYDNFGLPEELTDVIRHRIIPPPFDDDDFEKPALGALVTCELVGESNGRVIDERTTEWRVGQENLYGLPKGIGLAMQNFVLGEKSRVDLSGEMSSFGPGGGAGMVGILPPDATLTYTITLLEIRY